MRETGWLGWIWFAGIMMIVMGSFNAIEGLVALFRGEYYVVTEEQVLVFDLTAWGWITLLIGILVALAGGALLSGAAWARVVAVVLAVINAVAQLAFVSVHPLWSTIVIALCVTVIWAVVVHGSEANTTTNTTKFESTPHHR
ncbi:DUF7144 family membrane protein [Lentzea nigeriaca]|uniref:DUF7144 family membrane protein n=1 Tax=Lentzea nigeriaca TaxID=1128665 RepID=UPI00195D5C83|nr:hypothetical protein [Lentzea nigeriaca]MBM7858822.1 putative membrane protein YphA (DoxX/SURF4 family) [Lentzea nigeriaca]